MMRSFSKLKNISILQNNQRNLSANHLYIILIDFKKIKISKTSLMQKLMYHGVGSQVHYIPVPFHPYYKNNFKFNHKLIKILLHIIMLHYLYLYIITLKNKIKKKLLKH